MEPKQPTPVDPVLDYANPLTQAAERRPVVIDALAILVGSIMLLPLVAMLWDGPNGVEVWPWMVVCGCSAVGMLVGGILGVWRGEVGALVYTGAGLLMPWAAGCLVAAWLATSAIRTDDSIIVGGLCVWSCLAFVSLPAAAVGSMARLPADVPHARPLMIAIGVVVVLGGGVDLLDGQVAGNADGWLLAMVSVTVLSAAVALLIAIDSTEFALMATIVPWTLAHAAMLRFGYLELEAGMTVHPVTVLAIVTAPSTIFIWFRSWPD